MGIVLARLIDIYCLVLLAAVILSWVRPPGRNPLVRIVHAVTEPVLAPIRKVLPAVGGLDFSPMILLLGLQLLRNLLL